MATSQDVFINEGVFGVLDGGAITAETADWSNGLAAPMSQGALIVTGINTGYVRVTALAQNTSPLLDQDTEQWEEIVEISLHAPDGRLALESLELGPVANEPSHLSPSGPGWYRLRVFTRGREVLRDKVSMEPVEDYLLVTWPEARRESEVLKAGAGTRHP
ncbi:hypothetical protein [Streptomyces griseorubiginosus]|uniref:hypothetical protein n=1 Tax=Streptomyces griseorubiginosus TaxID=67304 RepID=UPI00364C0B89